VTLDDETLYGDVSVSGTTSFTFDSNGFVETTGLKLKNTKDYDTYGLSINVYTDPELYQHTRSAPVTVRSTTGCSGLVRTLAGFLRKHGGACANLGYTLKQCSSTIFVTVPT